MTKLSKINDQLMGLSLTELNQVLDMVYDVKILKAKSVLTVGARVYVVQKTKKTPGTVRKVNKTRAIVTMANGGDYNVPFSMLEAA